MPSTICPSCARRVFVNAQGECPSCGKGISLASKIATTAERQAGHPRVIAAAGAFGERVGAEDVSTNLATEQVGGKRFGKFAAIFSCLVPLVVFVFGGLITLIMETTSSMLLGILALLLALAIAVLVPTGLVAGIMGLLSNRQRMSITTGLLGCFGTLVNLVLFSVLLALLYYLWDEFATNPW